MAAAALTPHHPPAPPASSSSPHPRRRRAPAAAASPSSPITLVASDVDGTMLDSEQRLSQRVIQAVQKCEASGVPLVIATGKAPAAPWTAVLDRLGPPRPGIFMQGLFITDAAGRVLYSRTLDAAVVEAAQAWAAHPDRGYTLVAYCLPRVSGGGGGGGGGSAPIGSAAILATADDAASRRLVFFGEPPPAGVSGALTTAAAERGLEIYKLIAMTPPGDARLDSPDAWEDARKHLGQLCELTCALPGMIECLPAGASKGDGLLRLTGELETPPPEVMFVGDGANDADALLLAGWGVCVGNACEEAKACADVVLEETNDEAGLAVAIERFVLRC